MEHTPMSLEEWTKTCEFYEEDIIKMALQIGHLQNDSAVYDEQDDRFTIVDHREVEEYIVMYQTRIARAAKSLIRARSMVAPGKAMTHG